MPVWAAGFESPLRGDRDLAEDLADGELSPLPLSFTKHTPADDAVREDWNRQAFDVVRDDKTPPQNQGQALAGAIQRNGAASADPELQLLVRSRGGDNVEQIVVDGIVDADLASLLLKSAQLFQADHRLESVDRFAGAGAESAPVVRRREPGIPVRRRA